MPIEEQKLNKPEQKEKIDLKILIADDSADVTYMLTLLLGRRYTSVESVSNGPSLVEKLSDVNYMADFIITDNSMPKLNDGIEAIRKIRALSNRKDIPIILSSSDTTGTLRQEAEALGAFFLPKPVDPNELYATIEKLKLKNSESRG